MTLATKEQPGRRTQEQRSHDMRQRLIEATIVVLEEDGYSAASVSRVVEQAGVSRGAYLHHFPAKHDLMVAVGDALMRAIFRRAGDAVLSVQESEHRFASLVRYLWRDVIMNRDGQVFLELMQAGRTDQDLVKAFRPLTKRYMRLFEHAADHYFEPVDGRHETLVEVIQLVNWSLRGMLLDAVLVGDLSFFDRHIKMLIELASPKIKVRKVSGPPPKTADWYRET
mgnify:CR=1 FL=1